ncbi:MAG: cyclic nucleotide-binding domain-containing protein [Actinomycetota bacterium]|nr:cyclic nucleotide-binding domain-containing protein [Actinomycetota bacterium]
MPTVKELIDRLGSVYLFEDLSEKDLKALVGRATEVEHSAGHKIVTEGRGGVGFHLILEGHAQVLVHEQNHGWLGPGDYFGEMSLIDGQPRSATVRADTPVRTLSLTSWDFQPLLDDPVITKKLLLGVCKRLRSAEKVSQS